MDKGPNLVPPARENSHILWGFHRGSCHQTPAVRGRHPILCPFSISCWTSWPPRLESIGQLNLAGILTGSPKASHFYKKIGTSNLRYCPEEKGRQPTSLGKDCGSRILISFPQKCDKLVLICCKGVEKKTVRVLL